MLSAFVIVALLLVVVLFLLSWPIVGVAVVVVGDGGGGGGCGCFGCVLAAADHAPGGESVELLIVVQLLSAGTIPGRIYD